MRRLQEGAKRRRPWIGKSFLIIGILHSIIGLIIFHDSLGGMFRDHLMNTVTLNGDPRRLAAFWFLLTGGTLMIAGGLVGEIECRKSRLPAFLTWSFAAITLIGILIMPLSGFWLLLVPTAGLIAQRKKCKDVDLMAKV